MKIDQGISRRAVLLVRKFGEDESGATAIEYGLIAALIAIGIIAGAAKLGFDNSERIRCIGRAVDDSTLGRRCQNVGVG